MIPAGADTNNENLLFFSLNILLGLLLVQRRLLSKLACIVSRGEQKQKRNRNQEKRMRKIAGRERYFGKNDAIQVPQ